MYPKVIDFENNKLSLKFIKGMTLFQKMEEIKSYDNQKRTEFYPIIIKWFFSLLRFLTFIHSHNIVHSDIKPLNIIVNEENEIYVIDWELMRYQEKNNNKYFDASGTLLYMNPLVYRKFQNREDVSFEELKHNDKWALYKIFLEMFSDGWLDFNLGCYSSLNFHIKSENEKIFLEKLLEMIEFSKLNIVINILIPVNGYLTLKSNIIHSCDYSMLDRSNIIPISDYSMLDRTNIIPASNYSMLNNRSNIIL
jgi:serine/threonine protein kinase